MYSEQCSPTLAPTYSSGSSMEVIRGSKIQEVLHRLPDTKNYLYSVYNCQYGDFFQQLGKVEQFMKADRYMFTHYKYYVREVKIKAHAQSLESYKTIKLSYMADTFGD